MNKILKVALIISGIVIVLVLLSFTGFYSILNNSFNVLIAGKPDKYCNVDSDCVLKKTTCSVCDCGDAVNKNWNINCPPKNAEIVDCDDCPSPDRDFYIKCVNYQCQKTSRMK